jgi:hypothetical protein
MIGILKTVKQIANELTPAQQLQGAQYLLSKARQRIPGEEALVSESVLAKDWLRPEEDRAWANL